MRTKSKQYQNLLLSTQTYQGQPSEISFQKFQVFAKLNIINDYWYQVENLMTGEIGNAPKHLFKDLNISNENAVTPFEQDSQHSLEMQTSDLKDEYESLLNQLNTKLNQEMKQIWLSHVVSIGLLEYDFEAESEYEMEAKEGDLIFILDQKDPEWYIARSMMSLLHHQDVSLVFPGDPKMVPKTYVQVLNTPKWLQEYLQKQQEEIFDYSANMTSLPRVLTEGFTRHVAKISHANLIPQTPLSTPVTPFHESIEEAEILEYSRWMPKQDWTFVIKVIKRKQTLYLLRTFDDFYEMHSELLTAYPGYADGQRIIPYMPAPEKFITNQIAGKRRDSFNQYLQLICKLPEEIKYHEAYTYFFAFKPELDYDHYPDFLQKIPLSTLSRCFDPEPARDSFYESEEEEEIKERKQPRCWDIYTVYEQLPTSYPKQIQITPLQSPLLSSIPPPVPDKNEPIMPLLFRYSHQPSAIEEYISERDVEEAQRNLYFCSISSTPEVPKPPFPSRPRRPSLEERQQKKKKSGSKDKKQKQKQKSLDEGEGKKPRKRSVPKIFMFSPMMEKLEKVFHSKHLQYEKERKLRNKK